jgi:calcium-dependent protein kinase
MMHAILYFHARGIVHRDLKLDNVMIDGTGTGDLNDIRVKMIDFGMSKFTNYGGKKINLTTYAGTLDFMAPEILEGTDYDLTCDIWSLGVIAFFCLAGKPPFMGKDDTDLVRRITSCNYDFPDEEWANISKDA